MQNRKHQPIDRTLVGCLAGTLGICVLIVIMLSVLIEEDPIKASKKLPVIKYQYLIIDEQGDIEGIFSYGQDLESVLERLGKPDMARREFVSDMFHADVFEYRDYGLRIRCLLDTPYYCIEFNENSLKRLRFFDNEELDYPLRVDKILALFGPPDEVDEDPWTRVGPLKRKRFRYHRGEYNLDFRAIESS